MNATDKVIIPPQVMGRALGNETIILELTSGGYYSLDEVGARLWQLFAEGKTLSEVCDQVHAEYDVPRDRLEQDTIRFIDDLVAKHLVSVSS